MQQQLSKQDLEYAAHLAEIAPGYEHTVLVDVEKDREALKEIDFLHSELSEKRPVGNVVSTYRDGQGRLHYIIDPLSHELIIGSTGSGKSSLVFWTQIMAMAHSGVSMTVVDIKGVLYELVCDLLKGLGYKVRVINLSAPKHSEGWNPLAPIAQRYYDDMYSVGKGIKRERQGGATVYSYKGVTYDSKEELSVALELEQKSIRMDMRSEVKGVITKLFPVKRTNDDYWEESGHDMLCGLAMALICDQFALNPSKRTTIEQVNFANMRDIFDSFSVGRAVLYDNGFFSERGPNSVVYCQVKHGFFTNADVTFRNLMSFTSKCFRKYDENFYEITRLNTFSPADCVKEKVADFIVYDEGNTVNSDFISSFIAEVLEKTKKLADSFEGKALPRVKFFLLDEFASLPRATNMETYISTLRSRNIYVQLVIQAYSQLVSVYGEAAANTILNNCTTVYLYSSDGHTVEKFSRELGRRTIVSPTSVYSNGICLEERPVVTCCELSLTKLGEAYVKRFRDYPLKAAYEKSWQCPEYACPRSKLTDYVGSRKNYVKTVYDIRVIQKEPLFGDEEDEDDLF